MVGHYYLKGIHEVNTSILFLYQAYTKNWK